MRTERDIIERLVQGEVEDALEKALIGGGYLSVLRLLSKRLKEDALLSERGDYLMAHYALESATDSIRRKQEFLKPAQCAQILNCTVSHVSKLIGLGELRSEIVNDSYVGVKPSDLIAYKEKRDLERHQALCELADFAQDEGFTKRTN